MDLAIIDNLIQTLERELQENSQLLDLAHKKREIITSGQSKELTPINLLEQNCIKNIIEQEKLREVCIIQLQKNLGIGSITNINTVIESIDQEKAKELKDLASKLKNVLSQLKEINDLNQNLLDFALEYIEVNKNLMFGAKEPLIYNKKTDDKNSNQGSNNFDAKY